MQKRTIAHILLLVAMSHTPILANDDQGETTDNHVVLETTQIEVLYSEEGVVKTKVKASVALRYHNEDQAYPEGVYVEFYEEDKGVVATARANSAYYTAEKKVFEFRGDVEVINLHKKRQLNTESLCWDREQKKLYTDTFIRIESEENILTGQGLEAHEDLSQYQIPQPRGTASVKAVNK